MLRMHLASSWSKTDRGKRLKKPTLGFKWEEVDAEMIEGTSMPYASNTSREFDREEAVMIYFVPGMYVEEGMRYTDGVRRYIAIRSGQAESLTDETYFEAL